MRKKNLEFYVGLFVMVGICCVAYLVFALGEVGLFKDERYPVYAYFTSVSGLKNGATVEMAGVRIGKVKSVTLDTERMIAKVKLLIDSRIELSEDVYASVKTSGIIGDKYIDLSPGGSENLLNHGDNISNTESAIDLESLVRKYIFNAKKE